MDKYIIKINDFIKIKKLALNVEEAEIVYNEIAKHIDNNIIVLDFKELDVAITAFLNIIVGRVIKKYKEQYHEHIEFINESEVIKGQIERVIENALDQIAVK